MTQRLVWSGRLRGARRVAPLVAGTLGLVLFVVGASLVLDHASVRDVLADAGSRRLLRVVTRWHMVLRHSGAQMVELSIALVGLGLVGWALVQIVGPLLLRRWRKARRRHQPRPL